MVSWQVHSILLPCCEQLLLQLVYLTVQLLDVSRLGDALVHLGPASSKFSTEEACLVVVEAFANATLKDWIHHVNQ